MKKVLSMVLGLALAGTLLTGCGGSQAPETTAAANEAAAGESTEAVKEAAEGENAGGEAADGALKIAIVSSPSGVDDGSFNEDNYNGILAFIDAHPDATVTPVREETGDTTAAVQAVQDIVADYDVIVCCGFQFAAIGAIATDNPNVKFLLVDSYPSDAEGTEVACDNVYAMTFKEQESGFFAGMAAALETQTGKVAVVNGIAYPSNVNYQYGFESGVNYANAKLGASAEVVEIASYAGTDVTNANVGGNYVGSLPTRPRARW